MAHLATPHEKKLTEDDEDDPGGEQVRLPDGGVVRRAGEGPPVVGRPRPELDQAAQGLAAVGGGAEVGAVGLPRHGVALRPAEQRPRLGGACAKRNKCQKWVVCLIVCLFVSGLVRQPHLLHRRS